MKEKRTNKQFRNKGRGANEKPKITLTTCKKCGAKYPAGMTCPYNRSH